MGGQLRVNGDPKRPGDIKAYFRPEVKPEDKEMDWMLIFGMLFGMLALFLRVKLLSWMGLYFCLSYVATIQMQDMDVKQVISAFMFSIFGIVAAYMPLLAKLSPTK